MDKMRVPFCFCVHPDFVVFCIICLVICVIMFLFLTIFMSFCDYE